MNKPNNIKICLFELSDKDQAAIDRVVNFSASQGKQYTLWSELESADIVLANDSANLGELSAIVIRIGEQATETDDLVLAPPLLVSRVMRVIDKAVSMHAASAPIADTDKMAAQSAVADGKIETEEKVESKDKATIAAKSQAAAEKQKVKDDAASKEETESVEKLQAGDEAEITQKVKSAAVQKPKNTAEQIKEIKTLDTSVTETETEVEAGPKTDKDSEQFTALVVDDSAAIRKQLELELRVAKINADFAETGEEALEKSALKNYDLVFLDIVMPGIDGYEVCKQMRMRESMKKTPIVMLSGKTSPLDEVQGVIAGASTYLTKPVKHEMFQKTLNRLSAWLSDYSV